MKYTRILMKRNQYPNGYYMIVLTKKINAITSHK